MDDEMMAARNEAVAALFRLMPDSMFPESFEALMERVVRIEAIAAFRDTMDILSAIDKAWWHGYDEGRTALQRTEEVER